VLVVKDASRIIPPNLDTTIDVLCQAAKRNDINLIVFLLDRLVVGYTSKYQQIDVEQAQDSLEQIISETHELNSVTVGLQPEFMPRQSLPSLNYVTRLTPTELQRSLKKALENEEFSLYYQPVMSLITGEILEFEALLRWHHPHLGLISPQKFIATAEESGLIVPLQRWIIEAVCAQLKLWQGNPNFNHKVGVSINVPSLQLFQASLVKHLKFNLEQYQIAPNLITWEISEYLIGENPQEASIILPQLKQLGIQLQIDNFGRVASIYGGIRSNLIYREFDRAKIDRYLVNQIAKDHLTWDVFRKIVLDLKNQELKITTTGIENLAQLNKIKEIPVDYGQGNLLSQPLSVEDVDKVLGSNQALLKNSSLN
jgi:EAL domain-containing protein (putative c-di-GMP-specific phosphodiesterase class I)